MHCFEKLLDDPASSFKRQPIHAFTSCLLRQRQKRFSAAADTCSYHWSRQNERSDGTSSCEDAIISTWKNASKWFLVLTPRMTILTKRARNIHERDIHITSRTAFVDTGCSLVLIITMYRSVQTSRKVLRLICQVRWQAW